MARWGAAAGITAAVGLVACGSAGHEQSVSARSAGASAVVQMGVPHQGDLLVRGGVPARLRAASAGRVTVRARLRLDSGSELALGPAQEVALPADRSRRVLLPLGHPGRRALASCQPGHVVVSAGDSHQTKRLRLDPPGCATFFKRDTFWNRPIAPTTPLDPDSAAVTEELLRQVQYGMRRGPKPTINTSVSAPPVLTVGANQPLVRVRLDRPSGYAPELQRALAAVPLPAGARPAPGTDSELVLWQPSTDTLWEFWLLRRAADGWHAKWGGRMRNVSRGPGLFTASHEAWGESASGLPLPGGMITPRDLRSGSIDHALGLGIPRTRAGWFSRPARRTDGATNCRHAVPEGARFRLDPTLDVASLGLPRPVAAMARAAQRYGIFVRDRAGAVAFYAQNTNSLAADPYPLLFEGQTPQALVARFPWSRLQLMRMDLVRQKGTFPTPRALLPSCL
ncbi:MAG: hypothetical protein ACJ760_06230 [Thermoleophilaceae bacterium]